MRRLRKRNIVRDSMLLGTVAAVALLAPVAIGHATGAKNAQALLEDAEVRREAAVEARRIAIEREIERSIGHPWAARYYEGDGLGANIGITIAPKTGVAATLHGCLGLYDASLGAVVPQADGSLRFDFEQPNEPASAHFPQRLVPVRWSERRYLIKPEEMAAFAAAIHAGEEPRPHAGGRFLLAQGDERKLVAGRPGLPANQLARIRLQPVAARIVEVGEARRDGRIGGMCNAHYRVRLAVEGNEVLQAGEQLLEATSRSPLVDIAVDTSRRGEATGSIKVLEIHCGKPDPDERPTTEWHLTTGAYDETAANRAIAD